MCMQNIPCCVYLWIVERNLKIQHRILRVVCSCGLLRDTCVMHLHTFEYSYDVHKTHDSLQKEASGMLLQ